jgi:catalase (peroxidase I)
LATDVVSFAFLEPQANGFRNYLETGCVRPPAEALDSDARGLGVRLELRAALHRGEFYASNDSNEKFAQDFVKAWN